MKTNIRMVPGAGSGRNREMFVKGTNFILVIS